MTTRFLTLASLPGFLFILTACGPTAGKTDSSPPQLPLSANTASPTSQPNADDTNTNAPLAGLPPKVQREIKTQMDEGAVLCVDQANQGGQPIFHLQMTKEGVCRAFGAGDEEEAPSQVLESELPAAVKRVIESQFAKALLGVIERETEDGETLYTIEVKSDGRTNDLTVGEAGTWWSLEIELAQAPTPVQQTVRRLWGNLEVQSASKTAQDGETTYEIEAGKEDRQHTLTLAPDGRLLGREDEVPLNLVPVPVANTVKARIGRGKVERVTRAVSGDTVCYEVEASKDGQTVEFTLDAAGKILETSN